MFAAWGVRPSGPSLYRLGRTSNKLRGSPGSGKSPPPPGVSRLVTGPGFSPGNMEDPRAPAYAGVLPVGVSEWHASEAQSMGGGLTARDELGPLLRDADRRRPSDAVTARDRSGEGEHITHTGSEVGGDLGEKRVVRIL